jgi:hypothetical protein
MELQLQLLTSRPWLHETVQIESLRLPKISICLHSHTRVAYFHSPIRQCIVRSFCVSYRRKPLA